MPDWSDSPYILKKIALTSSAHTIISNPGTLFGYTIESAGAAQVDIWDGLSSTSTNTKLATWRVTGASSVDLIYPSDSGIPASSAITLACPTGTITGTVRYR